MDRVSGSFGAYTQAIEATLRHLVSADAVHKIWAKDATFWTDDAHVQGLIKNRLGWLTVADEMRGQVPQLTAFADEVRKAGFKNAILCRDAPERIG